MIASQYVIKVIPGATGLYAPGINSGGQILVGGSAGTSYLSDKGGLPLNNLSALGSGISPHYYNDSGQVLCAGFLSGPNGSLPVINFATGVYAASVNASGQVTGAYNDYAFLSNPNSSTINSIGALPGDSSSWGALVNNSGRVVGISNGSSGQRFFLSGPNGSSLQNLGPGPSGSTQSTSVVGINSVGQVVANAYFPSTPSPQHSYVLDTESNTFVDIGFLFGGFYTIGRAINDLGQIVGTANSHNTFSTFSTYNHAFIYDYGNMIDLNDIVIQNLGFLVTDAFGINNSGQISAAVYDRYGASHVALLIPTSILSTRTFN